MRENNEAKAAFEKQPILPAVDGGLPTPPAPPCTPEEYDQWFRAKVQEALDDPDPVYYSTEDVEAALEAIIERKRREKEARELSPVLSGLAKPAASVALSVTPGREPRENPSG